MEARNQRLMLVEFVLKCLGLVLAGMLFGGFLAMRLHAQPRSAVTQGDRGHDRRDHQGLDDGGDGRGDESKGGCT